MAGSAGGATSEEDGNSSVNSKRTNPLSSQSHRTTASNILSGSRPSSEVNLKCELLKAQEKFFKQRLDQELNSFNRSSIGIR